ncbi:hypothetical protein CIPAW_08G182700 [Carya illinoinensis]|uniref:Uncharacterized protein n=1 Tax=Carya illinoinensis TaxID=32201 RepID=A0A8T1PXY0_CARIL|nr:hypothetical protein CIPAW_08G182700 [Carya illinoinensis]
MKKRNKEERRSKRESFWFVLKREKQLFVLVTKETTRLKEKTEQGKEVACWLPVLHQCLRCRPERHFWSGSRLKKTSDDAQQFLGVGFTLSLSLSLLLFSLYRLKFS